MVPATAALKSTSYAPVFSGAGDFISVSFKDVCEAVVFDELF